MIVLHHTHANVNQALKVKAVQSVSNFFKFSTIQCFQQKNIIVKGCKINLLNSVILKHLYTIKFIFAACVEGFYGKNCISECKCQNGAKCNNTDGSCTCKPGFTGEFCENECDGFWGQDCANEVTCNITNTEHVNHVTGFCECGKGFKGEK